MGRPDQAAWDPGSFRCPRGRIYYHSGKVLRTVMPDAAADFQFVENTRLLDRLIDAGKLVAYSRSDDKHYPEAKEKPSFVLEHPALPFVSYPYEWCFYALQDAAILQLDICLEALRHEVMLEDATPYNIQFIHSRPIFIDHLSFRPYREGEVWVAHQQFCDQFLNPLLLRSLAGLTHNAWYKGCLDGISTPELKQTIPFHKKFSWNTFMHVVLLAHLLHGKAGNRVSKARQVQFGKNKLVYMLSGLKKWIAGLKPRPIASSVWHSYADNNSYQHQEKRKKQDAVAAFARKVKPSMLLDIGCNTGDYSLVALESGARLSVGIDHDSMAVEKAWLRAKKDKLDFLPLCMNVVNPSSGLGWNATERKGLKERLSADALLALALLHHLVIDKNIPMDAAVAGISGLAPAGIIEFVPKTDPMVQELLSLRKDIFPDYTEEAFKSCLEKQARIVASERVSETGRTLYQYARQ